MTPKRELRVFGGARFGLGTNWTWPFASFRADDDGLDLKAPWRRYAFRRDEVQALRIGRALLSMGLEIVHNRDDVPSPLIFWTLNADHLEANLSALDFEVTREKLSVGIELSTPHNKPLDLARRLTSFDRIPPRKLIADSTGESAARVNLA